jgi:tRNA pseudouridine32 synthase/23S rRNA pseudouridine746 synthase
VVEGHPPAAEGLIDLPLARLDQTRGWWMKVDALGLPSQTRWQVIGRMEQVSFLALEPLTGRTHQLRVHCAAQGWPILGDPIYGTGGKSAAALHLHARRVTIPLYNNKEPIEVTAPLPEHMRATLSALDYLPTY